MNIKGEARDDVTQGKNRTLCETMEEGDQHVWEQWRIVGKPLGGIVAEGGAPPTCSEEGATAQKQRTERVRKHGDASCAERNDA